MAGKDNSPSQEEIRAACLLIQAGWSPEEKLKRLRIDLRPHFRNITTGERLPMTQETYEEHIFSKGGTL